MLTLSSGGLQLTKDDVARHRRQQLDSPDDFVVVGDRVPSDLFIELVDSKKTPLFQNAFLQKVRPAVQTLPLSPTGRRQGLAPTGVSPVLRTSPVSLGYGCPPLPGQSPHTPCLLP